MQPRLSDYKRELTPLELNDILSSTVKHDEAAKNITFLSMLLAQTDEDQSNVSFQGESSLGKSYIPLEIAGYFPDSERKEYAGASPTSFFHEVGDLIPVSELGDGIKGVLDAKELDMKRKVVVVDLANKILIFIDQPSWQLMAKLRPLESHDKKYLRYSITDKTGKGGLRSKTVIIIGYCSIFFCTASQDPDQQEKTRTFMLFPEATPAKLRESLRLLARKISNREEYRTWLNEHPQRRWLKKRIELIRQSGIRNVVIKDWEGVYNRYVAQRPLLSPRSQRDLPRLMCLIKGFALLNCFNRVRQGEHTIIANEADVENGFALYDKVATLNELGLSYEDWAIYQALSSLPNAKSGVSMKEILSQYRRLLGRSFSYERLTRNVLPNLESAGLVELSDNPTDLREKLVQVTHQDALSSNQEQNSAAIEEQIQLGLNWLREETKAGRRTYLDGFISIVGDFRIVDIMKERSMIQVIYPVTGSPVVRLCKQE